MILRTEIKDNLIPILCFKNTDSTRTDSAGNRLVRFKIEYKTIMESNTSITRATVLADKKLQLKY